MHRVPGLFLLLVLALGAAQPVCAEEEAVDAEAFEQGLKIVHGAYDRKRYARGLELLGKLLKRHERKPWARGHRAELEDLALRLAFAEAFPPPKPADVVRGKIEKYDENKGYLRIHWDRESAVDMERHPDGYLIVPPRIRGPFLLEVFGRSYPFAIDDAPTMILDGGTASVGQTPRHWLVSFGSPERTEGDQKVWLPPRVIRYDEQTNHLVAQEALCPAVIGQPYRLQLKVNETRIHAGVNGKAAVTAKKAKGVSGWVGFKDRGWEKVIFTGTVEPSWMQGRIDRLVQQQLQTFQRTYSRQDHLPRWLFEADPEAPAPSARRDLPAPLETKHEAIARRFRKQVGCEDWRGARDSVRELREGGAPAVVTDFLAATVDARTRRLEDGLGEIERVVEADPAFVEGRLLQGEILQRLGRDDEAFAAFQRALALHAHDAQAYETAVTTMLRAGRPDAAGRIAEGAARAGVVSERLDGLSRAVTKALQGPVWNRVYRYKSRNYEVFSNTDKETCIEASKLLEQALTAYKVNFHWVGRDTEQHYKVYVFGGKAGLMRYWQDLGALLGRPPEHVAGVYVPYLKQLLIWTVGDRDAMLETIRHEGFHQYLDRLVDDVPVWLNEGLAVYHQKGEVRGGKLRFGQVHEDEVALLAKHPPLPLSEFLQLTPERFYYGPSAFRNYAQAWALVHLLKEGKASYRMLLKRIVKDLQEAPADEVIARHFPPETVAELEQALRAHLAGMRKAR